MSTTLVNPEHNYLFPYSSSANNNAAATSVPTSTAGESNNTNPTPTSVDTNVSSNSSICQKPRKASPNWTEFYKNGYPKEIIVISDDEDEDDEIVITNTSPAKSLVNDNNKRLLSRPPSPPHKKLRSKFPVVSYKPTTERVLKSSIIRVPLVRSYSPVLPNTDPAKTTPSCDDANGHLVIEDSTTLANGRFVIGKVLGQGTFGKVVSAFDKIKRKVCAVKIIRAIPKYREASKIELRVLSTIARYDPENQNRCIHLLECFDYKNHICIVMDLFGMSIFDFLESNHYIPFPRSHIKSFAKQLFSSVAYLHGLNLVHTDLKPENILLKSNNSYSEPLENHTKHKTRLVLEDTTIHLIDFGSAIFNDEYHSSVVSTRHYRAPEVILGIGWSFPCDIWSIGCILVEFCTGEALFPTYDDLEHLALMQRVFGKSIERYILHSASQNKIGAELLNKTTGKINYPNVNTKKKSEKHVKSTKSLRQTLKNVRPWLVDGATTGDVAEEQFWTDLLDLLERIFVYDPEKRITAEEALRHGFLNH